MMKKKFIQPEFFDRFGSDPLHLMLGHNAVRLVIDAVNLASVLEFPNHTPKVDHCSRRRIDNFIRRIS